MLNRSIKIINKRSYITTDEITIPNSIGELLTIPVNYISDGYSTVPDCGDILPAIAHAFAYECQRWDSMRRMTRLQADHLLLYLMRSSSDRCTRLAAYLYYAGVRQFGASRWKKNRKYSTM